jgi:hypothetical protein
MSSSKAISLWGLVMRGSYQELGGGQDGYALPGVQWVGTDYLVVGGAHYFALFQFRACLGLVSRVPT